MGLLEQIIEMKKEGMHEQDILNELQEKGFSPRQINDALSQEKIKSAVADEEEAFYAPTPQEETYAPQTQEIQEQGEYYPQQQYQEYYPQENYQGYESSSSDNTIEIAEQVFQEKIKTIQSQISKQTEFQTLAQTQLENISERLKRIEFAFDKMQIAILEKVGSYGKELNAMKKEISMVEDSFGKIAGSHTLKNPSSKTHKKR